MKRTTDAEPDERTGKAKKPSLVARLTGGRAKFVVIAVAVVMAAVAGRWIWERVREHVASRDDYRVTPADIAITAPPPWIRADVKAEVIHNGVSGEPMSILDDGLAERIHSLFSLHPWVAKVERVTKSHPAHVEVEIVYRRPVAMVQVTGGWFPVDAEGVLLPCEDFTAADTKAYPRLVGVESSPLGGAGTKWGDPIVAGGAKIGEALIAIWGDLGLRNIHWVKPAANSDPSAPAFYELITAAGNPIAWGSAPGSEQPAEPTAKEKTVRLMAYIATHGSLDDAPGGPKNLDLHRADTAPRTAARP